MALGVYAELFIEYSSSKARWLGHHRVNIKCVQQTGRGSVALRHSVPDDGGEALARNREAAARVAWHRG